MRFVRTSLRVDDPRSAGRALGSLLDLPSTACGVRIGWTEIVPVAREGAGVDHLAILIPGPSFAAARAWLASRTPLLDRAGTTDFEGPPGWDSTSVYFEGPSGCVLELIAHRAVRGSEAFAPASMLGVCEVGIGLPDVPAAVDQLRDAGLEPFAGTTSADFAAVGDLEGKLILAAEGRPWLPTADRLAGAGPLRIDASGLARRMQVGTATLVGVEP